jgi:hypothetical protein
MSGGELLLRWASCYPELRTARLLSAAERLCAPPVTMERDDPRMARYLRAAKRLMRNLVRIGHLEELTAERLRTVPPTVIVQDNDRCLILGARSEALQEKLANVLGGGVLQSLPQHEGPSVWRVHSDIETVTAAARTTGMTVAHDRGADLLASLPCVLETLRGAPAEAMPDKIERWDPDAPIGRPRWARVTANGHTPGLFRTAWKPHQWYLRQSDAARPVRLNTPERRVAAAWLLLSGKKRLQYSKSERVLSVPAIGIWLPLLLDRGLILASGRLPEQRSRQWDYFDIDPARARHAARILGTPLEVTT